MIVAVDTNILIDILNKDERHFELSKNLLNEALKHGALVINEIVHTELAGLFKEGENHD